MSSEDCCLVPNCKTTRKDGLNFFPMPDSTDDEEIRDKWITILKIPKQDYYSNQVCQIHFDETQFTTHPRVILKPDATPRPFLIEQDVKIEYDAESTLSQQPASYDLQNQKPPNQHTSILMKDLRICLERLPEPAPTPKVKKIKKIKDTAVTYYESFLSKASFVSYSSKSNFTLGCVLCQNKALLKEQWTFDETAEKFEDLKLFLCTILKLELRQFKYFPFCRECTTRVEELYNMYLELRMFQLKFDEETDDLKSDFIRIYLLSSGAISRPLIDDDYGDEIIENIIQKWNLVKCSYTTPGLLGSHESPYPFAKRFRTPNPPPEEIEPRTPPPDEIEPMTPPPMNIQRRNPTSMQAGTTKPVPIPVGTSNSVSINLGTANTAPNQVRRFTLPIRFVIQPPKVSTATVGVNTKISYNAYGISIDGDFNSDLLENNEQNILKPIGEKETNTHVAELQRKQVHSSSSEDLENSQVLPKISIKTENILEESSEAEAGSDFQQPVEESESKANIQKMSDQLIYTGETAHECSGCGEVFVQTADLSNHKRQVHGCQCHRNNSTVETNNYLHSKTRLYNCDLCSYLKFYTKTRYLRHIKDYHINREIMDGETICFYYCDNQNCKKSFSNLKKLKRHFVTDHHQKDTDLVNVCDVCDRVFCLKENLEIHKTSHSSVDTVYPCSYCHMVFTIEGELNDHIPRHKIEFKLSQFSHLCELCGEGFLSMLSLFHHKTITCQTPRSGKQGQLRKGAPHKIKCVKTKKIKPFIIRGRKQARKDKYISTCEFCGKTGITCNIKLHRFIHTHPEGFKCNTCKYVAKNPLYLKQHLITVHSTTVDAEQKYVCDICQRPFTGIRILNVHMLRHHPKDYLQGKVHCISCFQIFDTHESMNVHFEEEHTKKIFHVNDCGRKGVKSSLRNQSRVHSEERPHQCSFCKDSFKADSTLWYHVMKCHKNHRNFFCKLCVTNPGFYDRRAFFKHASINHPELTPTEIMKTNYAKRSCDPYPKSK